jgi:hypothetical protein
MARIFFAMEEIQHKIAARAGRALTTMDDGYDLIIEACATDDGCYQPIIRGVQGELYLLHTTNLAGYLLRRGIRMQDCRWELQPQQTETPRGAHLLVAPRLRLPSKIR